MKRRRSIPKIMVALAATCILFYHNGQSQDRQPNDTIENYTFDEVVITANRYQNKILYSGAAVSSIDHKKIAQLPVTTLSETLRFLPGIYMASTDGMGLNPQVSIRGFFGGGEAEYMTVLVDGIPVNNLVNGLANWNVIPLGQVNRIEMLRGGSSPLYGDAAMGGVMNIRTNRTEPEFTNASIGYGSYNTYNIGAAHGGKAGKVTYELYLNNTATDGYREHSNWNSVNFGGKVNVPLSRYSSVSFRSYNQILSADEPGFYIDTIINQDREESLPYFREDGREQKKYLASLEFRTQINPQSSLSVDLHYQRNNSDQTRTYGQYPITGYFTENGFNPTGIFTDSSLFADTKKRELTTDQINFAVRTLSEIPGWDARITGGIEAEYGFFDNSVSDIFRGFNKDYANDYLPYDSIDVKGDGFRFKSAAYLNGEMRLLDPLKLLAGVRYDFISDDYNGSFPDTTITKSNSAVSPKIGLSLTTGDSDEYAGSIYVNFSTAFKAPTIDQRTDFKKLHYSLFIEAGPSYFPIEYQAEPFANADLDPQKSTNYEIGTYHSYRFSDRVSGEISLAGYLIRVKDEIDFDIHTRKYRNINNTNHSGLETILRINYTDLASAFINYTYSEVTFSDGALEGHQLKGIPSNIYTAGIRVDRPEGLGGSLIYTGASGMYLDDENTQKLDAYGILNARVKYRISFASIYLDVNNIFNTSYNSTGYLIDNVRYLYPAMGRFIKGGVMFSF